MFKPACKWEEEVKVRKVNYFMDGGFYSFFALVDGVHHFHDYCWWHQSWSVHKACWWFNQYKQIWRWMSITCIVYMSRHGGSIVYVYCGFYHPYQNETLHCKQRERVHVYELGKWAYVTKMTYLYQVETEFCN